MLSRVRHMAVPVLLLATIATDMHAATRDDDLLVDPTAPLVGLTVVDGNTDGADAGGSFFNMFDVFTSYELSSVLIRAEDRIAVINDERVRVGDKVGSAVVAAIEPDHVRLNVDGEIQILKLYENSIKTRVTGDD